MGPEDYFSDNDQPEHYPSNVYVHGNGFVQINLGGEPETRIHIWTPGLMEMCQKVNTAHHNHRFGFVSSVLKGGQRNINLRFNPCKLGGWQEWKATGERGPKGNRPLVAQPGEYERVTVDGATYYAGSWYEMKPCDFHFTKPIWDYKAEHEAVVTLMTKTAILNESVFMASVMCQTDREPDQEYDRTQMPWPELFHKHIQPALRDTPFENAVVFRG